MGLLDDAIREHLELKRRRGADPTQVAREQREALDPVPGRGARSETGDAARGEPLGEAPREEEEREALTSAQTQQGAVAHEEAPAVASPAPIPAVSPGPVGEAGSMEETAELDMNAVLQHEAPSEFEPSAAEDPLEWEVPEQLDSQSGSEPREVADPAAEAGSRGQGEERDVVGDAPEQERLHFEQRAPGHANTDR